MPINSFIYPAPSTPSPYSVANSCRFNDDDSAYMHITPGSNGNRQTFTISVWLKRGTLGSDQVILGSSDGSFGNGMFLQFQSDDTLRFGFQDPNQFKATNRVFRDCSAWYNIIVAVDVNEASNSDRVKIYVNGTQETSFGTDNTMTDVDKDWNNTQKHAIGRSGDYDSKYFDGYLAEVVNIDGQQLAATSFGEFDEDSPTIWKPIDVSGLTFGTNGFYLDFEASDNLGNDANGGTDLTESGLAAADQATDTPTNSFCTINPLYKWYAAATLSEGNCKVVDTSGGWAGAKGTMAVSTGKWYWEIKLSGTMANHYHGVQEINVEGASAINPHTLTGTTLIYNYDGGETIIDGSASTSDYGTLDSGDILGIALDMDAGSYGQFTIYDQNSAIASNINLSSSSDYVIPASFILSCTAEFNFGGCSSFTISSAANDENGYGNFEFAPPSGYLALCTKNLGSDGG